MGRGGSELVGLQERFALCVGRLLIWCHVSGYGVGFGEAWRPVETAELYARQGRGLRDSLHCDRLAVDLVLRRGGELLEGFSVVEPVGEYWESLDPRAAWGGRFGSADLWHFSFAYRGRR